MMLLLIMLGEGMGVGGSVRTASPKGTEAVRSSRSGPSDLC